MYVDLIQVRHPLIGDNRFWLCCAYGGIEKPQTNSSFQLKIVKSGSQEHKKGKKIMFKKIILKLFENII